MNFRTVWGGVETIKILHTTQTPSLSLKQHGQFETIKILHTTQTL